MRRLLVLLLLAPALHAAEVRVFAAASLTNVLRDIAARYEKSSPDRVVFNFAGSSVLERQIEEGAPADIFISADEEKMNRLERRGLINRRSRVSVLSNTLVIVGNGDLLRAASIALAEPSSVPAGIYAREWLMKKRLWERVKSKVIPTENVRAALAAVESGNADSAIVYRTDALIAKHARVALEVPRDEGPRISYPFALTSDATPAARRFFAYLTSPAALEIFRRHGFLTR